jgi:hypothetical protein
MGVAIASITTRTTGDAKIVAAIADGMSRIAPKGAAVSHASNEYAGQSGNGGLESGPDMSEHEHDEAGDVARAEQNHAWHAVSLLLAGLVFWGGIGWLVGRWLDSQLFTAAGILLGVGLALYLVWIRYGRA